MKEYFLTFQRASGLKVVWRGKKFEDRYTQVALCLWESLQASHTFFTSDAYALFHKTIQPALNGRKVNWANHALLDHSKLSDRSHLESILSSPAIEVALTKVVEGGTAGYYSQFNKVVTGILDQESGCDGYFISPLIEYPEDQLLLINWKSVDVSSRAFYKLERELTFVPRLTMKNLKRSLVSRGALMLCMTIIRNLSFRGTLQS